MQAYPNGPGFSADGTSKEAARSANLWANATRIRCLILLMNEPMTGYELAAKMRLDEHCVQPRVSELRALGLVEPSGVRRPTPSGHSAIVWRVVRSKLPEELRWTGQGDLFR